MKKYLHIILCLTAAFICACQQEEISSSITNEEVADQMLYVPGKARIKVSEGLSRVAEEGDGTGIVPGAVITRTFPHGGRYEDRMRRAGLHLWYDVDFEESAPLTKAGESLMHIDGIDVVEFIPIAVRQEKTGSFSFNDPDLRKQWHYINSGNALTGLVAGCDINVAPAWERGVVGNERVIVAVVDDGVDINHEDLKDNIWNGTDEAGNLIHGYNFVSESHKIFPGDHGTHVAGTIAAVNNNGIGVAGVAGGDAAKGIRGVQIMSCQIFQGDSNGNDASALVWAANNGAVIAQNSWVFLNNHDAIPEYMKVAIDYFNTYAGCDEDGNQLPDSPMKGGVVIFAAGNDQKSLSYPGAYEGCIAVSALSGDFNLAYYSNFGDWIDIAAPGGDASKSQTIFSTVCDNGYDHMQGTSMACPHVSGVAALIVSEFGGQGFTREDLISRLLNTATDIGLSKKYMGAGLVNASAATAHYGEKLPYAPVYAKNDELSGTSYELKFIVPEDNEGVECRNAELYYGTAPFTEISESQTRILKSTNGLNPGDTLSFVVEGLEFNTTYYFSVRGCDVFENTSALSENLAFTTRGNLPPTIKALDAVDLTLKQYVNFTKLRFEVVDPENKLKEVRYENATDSDVFSAKDGLYQIVIDATKIKAGTYHSRIVASDEDGMTSECEITFVVEENVAPEAIKQMENILFKSNSGTKTVTLSDYFKDADGETLTYSAVPSSESVVKVSVAKNTLTLTSGEYGETEIVVTATDAMKKTAQSVFKVVVMDGSKACSLYPNPVRDVVNVRVLNDAANTAFKVVSALGSVVYEGSYQNVSPFAPVSADLSGLVPGAYTAVVVMDGTEYKQQIVKL